MPRAVALAALLCLSLLAPPSAFAAPKHRIAFRLDYDAPPDASCPDAEEVALMLAAEFGYVVVRPDAPAVVRVDVQKVKKGFQAEVQAPPMIDGAEAWQGVTDAQGTCRELAYDVAALVQILLGPRAWPGEAPPAHLATAPEAEAASPGSTCTPAPKAEPEPAATPAIEVVPSAPSAPLVVTKAKGDRALGIYVERYIKQEDPYGYDGQPAEPETKASMRGFVGMGPVVVFGAATWAPAVGASITGGLRLHEHVSVELEGRAAWLAGDVKGNPITTMTAGGLLGLCGHWRWLFGCGLGHVGVISVSGDEEAFQDKTDVFLRPGFGGRVGGRFELGTAWGVQVAGDVLGLSRATRIALGQTILVEQPAIMVGTSLAAFWKF